MKLNNINADAFNCSSPNGGMFGLGTILNRIIDAVNANTVKLSELEAKTDTENVQIKAAPTAIKAVKKAK